MTVSQFADDLAVHVSQVSVESCNNLLLKAIDAIHENSWHLGLDLRPRKTVLIYFNKRGVKPGDVALYIQDTYVHSCETVKFLGITFDYRPSFHNHVIGIRDKCKRALNIIKYVRGTWWVAEPATLFTIYVSFVGSIMDYGSFIYFPSGRTFRDKLESIQLSAICIALGLRLSNPRMRFWWSPNWSGCRSGHFWGGSIYTKSCPIPNFASAQLLFAWSVK